MFLPLSVSITVELAAFPLLGCARALLVVRTGWPHTGFFMLSFVKNVDCIIVLQLLWEQNCVNFAVAKEVDIISYSKLCLPVHSAVCAVCLGPLLKCVGIDLPCSHGEQRFFVFEHCLQDLIAVQDTQFRRSGLKFCSWSFRCLQCKEVLEGEWVGFMLTLV